MSTPFDSDEDRFLNALSEAEPGECVALGLDARIRALEEKIVTKPPTEATADQLVKFHIINGRETFITMNATKVLTEELTNHPPPRLVSPLRYDKPVQVFVHTMIDVKNLESAVPPSHAKRILLLTNKIAECSSLLQRMMMKTETTGTWPSEDDHNALLRLCIEDSFGKLFLHANESEAAATVAGNESKKMKTGNEGL
jgi:hypothetical protein